MTGHKQIEEYLPDYAFGNLGHLDSNLISEHISTCESCQVLLRSYEETVGLLAFGVSKVDPPESLKPALMKRIDNISSPRVAKTPETTIRSWGYLFQWFSPTLAMACLVVIISLATANVMQWNQRNTLHSQLSAPLKIFKMRGTHQAPHADGTFVIGQDTFHGVLVASDLPKIPNNKQFQLWLIRNGEKINGGTFSTTALGYGVMEVLSPRPLPEFQTAAVTMEPFGGSPFPSGPELMVGTF